MDEEEIIIGIGELVVHHNPVTLSAVGLGSCVGVALYDKDAQIGGLAHVMLPQKPEGKDPKEVNNNKYADVAIPKMIEEMTKLGAKKENIHAKIVGGAHMFPTLQCDINNIGQRNAESIKKVLKENNIPLDAEDLGGNCGRSIKFDTKTQKIKVKTLNQIKEL